MKSKVINRTEPTEVRKSDPTAHHHSPLRNEMLAKFFGEAELKSRPPSVTIGKPVEEVYKFFRDFKHAPLFMKGLKSVTQSTNKVTHWNFDENGVVESFDVEIVSEEPNQMLTWKLLNAKGKEDYGIATFEKASGSLSGHSGTVVSLHMSGEKAPGKILGVASFFAGGEPKTRSQINLRRLKAYMECGEVPTIEGQPNGRDEANNQQKQ